MKLLELKEALNEAYLNFYYTRDESYYALFYKLTHKFLKNFIRKYYIKSLVDCEDVIAEVYEIMYTKVNLFSDEYAPYNWMTTIAVNQALQKIKQRKKTNAVEILDDKYSINEGYRYAEYTEELYVAIEQLTDPHKSIVEMKLDGISEEEIGELLDMNVKAVKSRYRHAKLMLRNILEGEYIFKGVANCSKPYKPTKKTKI